jgi:hypothetical protein
LGNTRCTYANSSVVPCRNSSHPSAMTTKTYPLNEQLKYLPPLRPENEAKSQLAALKKKDTALGGNAFHSSKIRHCIRCSACRAPRCIYSDKEIVFIHKQDSTKNGPTESDMDRLNDLEADGFICGDTIREIDTFRARAAMRLSLCTINKRTSGPPVQDALEEGQWLRNAWSKRAEKQRAKLSYHCARTVLRLACLRFL